MILPLEKQVPTPETCRRLQDAGFEAETLYVWQGPPTHKTWDLHQNGLLRAPSYYESILPAPTAAELGALLPTHLKGQYTFDVWRLNDAWIVRYVKSTECGEEDLATPQATTEAEARALLWLDLDAKGLLPDAAYGAEVNG